MLKKINNPLRTLHEAQEEINQELKKTTSGLDIFGFSDLK